MSETATAARPGLVRRSYDWVLSLADTRFGTLALAVLAFAESSFFPIPPDVLLIALCLGNPKASFRFALVCSLFSVLGGVGGYYIGYALEDVGRWIITHVASAEKFDVVAGYYRDDAFFYITVAAFTPIPYKVFTIAAGMFHDFVSLQTLVLASIVGRTARFMLVSFLIWRFGPPVKRMIDRYFDRLMWTFLILLVLGFGAIKYMGGHKPLSVETAEQALTSPVDGERHMMIKRIREAAGREFGYDPERPVADPANQTAIEEILAWLAAQPKEDGGD